MVRLMIEADVKDRARLLIHLDERLSGREPAVLDDAAPAMPPFVLLIGANGNQMALGYAPQGVVPGMESLMPSQVKALLPPHGNGKGNGNGRRSSR